MRMAGKKQEAINKNCRDCCGDELDAGTWREQVERCQITECPLYDFRPKTIKAERCKGIEGDVVGKINQLEAPRLH